MKAAHRPGFSLPEDLAAVVVGLGIVILALAVTWQARPASDAGSRERHPKGWPTPLAATVGMPGAWADAPLDAFRDKQGEVAAGPIVLGMGWIVAIAVAGAALGGRSVRACLPGAILLAGLACLAYVLSGQKVVKFYNLEYPLWALAVGLSLFFTVIMMVAMPPVIRWMGLDPILGGAWIGGTIDATGAVVAAGESLGKEAGEVAATVKMIQNSMIGLIAFAVAVYWAGWVERDPAGPRGTLAGEAWRRFPRFILGFLAASLVCSWLHALGPEQALWVDGATIGFTAKLRGWLFCTGFVCMGLQTSVRELAPYLASGRPVGASIRRRCITPSSSGSRCRRRGWKPA